MPTPAADRIAALSFDPTLDLPSAIRRIAAITPDAPALSGGAQSYSYSALLAAADRIAAHLRAAGVAPGDPVAVIAERRPETIVAILGTHRAGALCLPLDPAYDRERLAFYLADARPTALIVDRTHAAMAADLDAALPAKARPCLELATVLASPAPDTAGLPAQSGDDAGFLFYTSGSTGRPKGVLVPHRAITRLAHGCPSGPLTPDDVSIASSTLACDGAGWEIWPALLGGAEVVVVTQPKPALDVIAKTMSEAGATYASLYTGIAHLMIDHHPEALAGLRQLHAGGDVLSVAALTRLRAVAPKLQVVNCYGPTENGVVTTAHVVTEADLTAGAIPIGRPFHAEDCFVLGDDGALLGTGEIGQLVAAGPGVALGYLGRPELSDAAFIDDPRPGRSGKVYLTGDLVARRADGVYAFHGRADRQVKLGGRRIELDEIEQALRALPMLADAAVVLAPAPTGPARIAGFAVPAGEMPADRAGFGRAVQAALGAVLPAGLVPQLLRVVPVLPLTEAGKVDRKGLVAALEAQPRGLELDQPVPDQPKTAAKAAPMTAAAIELLIAELWDAALGCGPVDRDATFFEAGGTSLQLVDLHAQLVEALGRRFDITLLFEVPRLGAQAARLAALLSENTEEVAPAPSQTPPQAPQPKAPRRAHSAPQHAPGDETAAIAITGMAARLPGVESLDDFWSQLRAGTNLVRPHAPEDLEDTLPPERRASPAYQPVRPDLPDAALFDAKFFGMYPREAAVTDPQARLLLELAYEALEASGHDPFAGTLPVGVFAGASLSTYLLHNLIADRAAAEDYAQTYQTGKFAEMTGNLGDCLATRVAYKLNLRGPAITVQTACSTSLTAIAQAVLALRAGQCDMALAGGVSITFPQKRGYIAQEGGLASDDGTCRPFDAAASGTVFSHGGGVVVLRRLDEALADGDRVHAVIRGVGLNNDGADKIAFTAPSVTGQAAAILMAQADAGVAPETVSYVECHGTATPLGDPVEVQGLRKAFGAGLAEGSCALGSVKGNIGHLDAAAGVTAVLKTALMLTHKIVPPVANFTKLNPKITLDGTPFRVPQVAEAWRAPGPLRAGVSAFGVGGTNVHLVLEEAPVSAAVPVPGPQVLPLSAKSPEALGAMQARLAEALEAEGAPALGDVAFTLQEGRPGFAHRAVFAGDDPARLAAALRDTAPPRTPAGEAPEVTFLFPGQGAQYPGMGRGLYAAEPEYARWIDQGAEILQPQLGCDIRALLCAADPSDKAAATALRETRLTQPALFLTQYACAKLWQARGVVPGAMIGHSVGELTAATLAGVMRFETGLEVIAKRGALMQAQPAGAMLSVRAPFEAVEPYLDASIDLAARNAPKASVLAGGLEAIAALEAKLAEAGLACTRLHTSHAFHSAMMDPVAAGLCEALAEVPLAGPEIPFVSTVTGDWITPAEATDPGYWGRQARATVDFEGALLRLGSGPRVLVEIGAGATLSTFAHQTLPREGGVAVVQSLPDHRRATPDTEAMARAFGGLWAAGVAVDWARLGPRGRARVPLPSYPFERQRHWVAPPAPVATPAAPAALPAHREDLPMPSVPAAPVQSPAQTPDQRPQAPAGGRALHHAERDLRRGAHRGGCRPALPRPRVRFAVFGAGEPEARGRLRG